MKPEPYVYSGGRLTQYVPPFGTKDFPQAMVDDRQWYREFEKAVGKIDMNGSAFLQKSLMGYQKFMYLLCKYPRKMEKIQFAPVPPIDLIWHTYLAQPQAYKKDCTRLIDSVVHHKLLPKK